MSESCTKSNCEGCSKSCGSRKAEQKPQVTGNDRVKKVIAVVSGKGGVGKSLVTSMLTTKSQANGLSTAILDADITGPSIPRAFGVRQMAEVDDSDEMLIPSTCSNGIKLMSMNLLMAEETDPVIWRGPIIAGTVKEFWEKVSWGDVDCMFVDCPPGTGDVPLTVFQSMRIDGIVIVTTPQDLVSMIVGKAVSMARMMNVPILGLVENMSYFVCPACGKEHDIFGHSHVKETAEDFDIAVSARLPMDPHVAELVDSGRITEVDTSALDEIYKAIIEA